MTNVFVLSTHFGRILIVLGEWNMALRKFKRLTAQPHLWVATKLKFIVIKILSHTVFIITESRKKLSLLPFHFIIVSVSEHEHFFLPPPPHSSIIFCFFSSKSDKSFKRKKILYCCRVVSRAAVYIAFCSCLASQSRLCNKTLTSWESYVVSRLVHGLVQFFSS